MYCRLVDTCLEQEFCFEKCNNACGNTFIVGSLRLKKWPTTALFVTGAKLGTNDL